MLFCMYIYIYIEREREREREREEREIDIDRLYTCNVTVLYYILASFQKINVNVNGSSGTHSACVCTYHQNVKLMLSCIDRSLDSKEVLKFYVCDVNNENCMIHHCHDCPN